jgi:3-hydroxymyristoyl/3-hydroxydecanoyl-(acyl carrier protein) dehydratase
MNMSMPISEIEQLIPHRAPFLFVDEVIERTSTTIMCQKKISLEDRYLVYTESNEPYVSQVALIECILQSGACLLSGNDFVSITVEKKQKYYIGSPVVKFNIIPRIGDTLTMYVEIVQKFGQNSRLQGKIFSKAELVLEGVFLVADK